MATIVGALGRLAKHKRKWYGPFLSRNVSDKAKLFDKILIANRGEIACRVMRTSHRLGIKSVAVYSDADKHAMHTTMSNEAYCIGPAPSNESYLKMDAIIDVAKRTGSQAIHPGYGFLSENKHFAELCQKEGIEFIGPSPSAIEKMGVKRVSKEIMNNSSVPIVPGYYGNDQSNDNLQLEADNIGYPVLIKADLGGGGKGMRIVNNRTEFQSMLEACRSEAMKSFNDDKVLLEKYLLRPRHVEVQVFGDKFGNTVHLFERDCSVQRRHQKIIEEAPAPNLKQSTKEAIWSAAVRAAQAVNYVGAGTVEFIMDQDESFYFMEMNTRLQVEHPITELITGVDLVEWQIRVAAGQPLLLAQSDIVQRGHAFEARIYAENPAQSFQPSPGVLRHLVTPLPSNTVRIDTGVEQGDEVTTFYDPMIAKLVVWSDNRQIALNKLIQALNQYQIVGVHSNLSFLTSLGKHQSFQEGDVHTGFIEQHQDELFPSDEELSVDQKQLAILALLLLEDQKQSKQPSLDPNSLFNINNGARVNSDLFRKISLSSNDKLFNGFVQYAKGKFSISVDQNEWVSVTGKLSELDKRHLHLTGFIGERKVSADIVAANDSIYCFTNNGNSFSVQIPQPEYFSRGSLDSMDGARSPAYSSRVNKVLVKAGDLVEKGQVVMTVEGMKMETSILAPDNGEIIEVFYKDNDIVPGNSRVLELKI